MKHLTFLGLALLLGVVPARAQLVEANQIGVTMGHIHLAVKDVDAQKQFWISVMGGALVANASQAPAHSWNAPQTGAQLWHPGHQYVVRLASPCPRARTRVPHRGQGRPARP